MVETVFLRLVTEVEDPVFGTGGKRYGDFVREVRIDRSDPRCEELLDFAKRMRAAKTIFALSWDIRRSYTPTELSAAECFHLQPVWRLVWSTDSGTPYDESVACPECGNGAVQVGDLCLDLRKVSASASLFLTYTGEIVVSERLAEHLAAASLTGYELGPVHHKGYYMRDSITYKTVPSGRELLRLARSKGKAEEPGFSIWLNSNPDAIRLSKDAWQEQAARKAAREARHPRAWPVWYQLRILDTNAEIVPPTDVGGGIPEYTPGDRGQCWMGDLLGTALLSELYICRDTRGSADVAATRQLVGTRKGENMVPSGRRQILLSPRFRHALVDFGPLRGTRMDVVHLV